MAAPPIPPVPVNQTSIAAGFGLLASDNPSRGPGLCLLGNSITAQNLNTSTGVVQQLGRGYWTWAQQFLGQRFYTPPSYNFGVASDTIALASVRIPSVIATGAKLCVVELGTNDILNGRSFSQIKSDYVSLIFKPLMNAGILPIVLSVLPIDSTVSGMTSDKILTWAAVNTWLRELCAGQNNLLSAANMPYPPLLVNANNYMEDLTKPAGSLANLPGYTRDGVHPSGRGAWWIGYAFSNALSALTPQRKTNVVSPSDLYNSTYNATGNMVSNGALNGTAGTNATATGLTPTGVVATGLTAQRHSGTSTATLVSSKQNPRTDGPNSGERQQMVVTVTGAGLTNELYGYQLQSNVSVSANETYFAEIDYQITGTPVNLIGVQLKLFTGGGGVGQESTDGLCDTASIGTLPGVAFSGTLRTPLLTTASGNTAMNVAIDVALQTDGGSASATVLFGDLAIWRVS